MSVEKMYICAHRTTKGCTQLIVTAEKPPKCHGTRMVTPTQPKLTVVEGEKKSSK